jgi:hypothetical protein
MGHHPNRYKWDTVPITDQFQGHCGRGGRPDLHAHSDPKTPTRAPSAKIRIFHPPKRPRKRNEEDFVGRGQERLGARWTSFGAPRYFRAIFHLGCGERLTTCRFLIRNQSAERRKCRRRHSRAGGTGSQFLNVLGEVGRGPISAVCHVAKRGERGGTRVCTGVQPRRLPEHSGAGCSATKRGNGVLKHFGIRADVGVPGCGTSPAGGTARAPGADPPRLSDVTIQVPARM